MADQIGSELLLQSPPNESEPILNDLLIIVDNGDGRLEERAAFIEASKQRNWLSFPVVRLPASEDLEGMPERSCLITEFNLLDAENNVYYDPINRQKFRLDPLSLSVNSVEDLADEEVSGNEELSSQVSAYFADSFPNGAWGVYSGPNEAEWVAVLVGSKWDIKNYWNGQWASVWKLSGKQVKGEINVFVHFQEEGNIQLKTTKSVAFELNVATPEACIQKIKSAEDSVQLALNETYQKLSQTTFRRLRRQLPITRMKMDWAKIEAYGLGSELASKSKAS